MKTISTIILLAAFQFTFGQNLHESIKGHWSYCDKNNGYSEILITDTLIDWINEDLFLFSPQSYRINNTFILTLNDNLNFADTTLVQVLDSNKIVLTRQNTSDTLVRLNPPVLSFYDFNCDLKMSPNQFDNFLYQEFIVRSIKNKHLCDPKILKINDNPYPDLGELTLMNDIESDTSQSNVHLMHFDYKLIEVNNESNFNPRLIEIKYNKDTTEALILIDFIGLCYGNYYSNQLIQSDNSISLEVKQRSKTPCEDMCHLRFYFNLYLNDYKIENLLFNNQKIK